jgi:hypothetical protein
MKKTCWVVIMLATGVIFFIGCRSKPPAASSSVASAVITTKHGQIKVQQIAEIQPGVGTVMIEYATRFNSLWFAVQKSNWEMAHYQILEMREIQKVGETTRPNRAVALKSFESGFLDPIDKAVLGKDSNAFTAVYDAAIAGCNGCHVTSSSSEFKTYKFVKITQPTAPDFSNLDFVGQ